MPAGTGAVGAGAVPAAEGKLTSPCAEAPAVAQSSAEAGATRPGVDSGAASAGPEGSVPPAAEAVPGAAEREQAAGGLAGGRAVEGAEGRAAAATSPDGELRHAEEPASATETSGVMAGHDVEQACPAGVDITYT